MEVQRRRGTTSPDPEKSQSLQEDLSEVFLWEIHREEKNPKSLQGAIFLREALGGLSTSGVAPPLFFKKIFWDILMIKRAIPPSAIPSRKGRSRDMGGYISHWAASVLRLVILRASLTVKIRP